MPGSIWRAARCSATMRCAVASMSSACSLPSGRASCSRRAAPSAVPTNLVPMPHSPAAMAACMDSGAPR
ncbi:Uncharacterised protein [Bordetella pertussis]|nr:Uncharacterised protein [Bordetella pertussis]